jgi:hypothetical protein
MGGQITTDGPLWYGVERQPSWRLPLSEVCRGISVDNFALIPPNTPKCKVVEK